jgi:L-asparaginase
MSIIYFQCGGTIDKNYFSSAGNHGYNFEIASPAAERTLARVPGIAASHTASILKKDSLDMTDDDRALVAAAIIECPGNHIVITHGTDTILKTAEAVSSIPNKTIVFTGSFLPEVFRNSDADFNIGMAHAGAQILPPGVYIALNGTIVPWQQYRPIQ